MGGDTWKVVGGADKGGILVREGKDTASRQLQERLAFGALVREAELVGERLCFQKVAGAGPETGWVSIRLKDKVLLEQISSDSAPAPSSALGLSAAGAEKAQAQPAECEEWIVVHERVVRRAEPCKDAKILAVEKRGASIRGTVVDVAGLRWLKAPMAKAVGGELDTFMMIDGSSVGLGVLLERAAPAIVEGDYWVMQGTLFKKTDTDPETNKITRLSLPVGSVVKTTGKTWRGPSGGEWVEVDSAVEKAGWLLVEGPGFNVPGPLLQKAELGQVRPLVLKLYSLITSSELCEICAHPGQTVADLKRWVALRDPHGLKAAKVLVAKEMPSEDERGSFSIASFPAHKLFQDTVKVSDANLKSGDFLPYFYMGEASDDGRFS